MLARVVFGILSYLFELQPYGPNSYVTHFRASHLLVPELCRACNKRVASAAGTCGFEFLLFALATVRGLTGESLVIH